jgi:aminopeptidase N
LKKLRNDHLAELGSSKSVSQGMEVAEANVLWVQRHYDTIVNWLKSQTPAVTTSSSTASSTSSTTKASTTTPSSASSVYRKKFSDTIAIVAFTGFWILASYFP